MSRTIKTLEQIVADVRRETKRSTNRNFGIDEYDAIAYLVQRTQRRLWWACDWKFLNCRRDVTLNAGQRYYDMPDELSFERIQIAKTRFGSEWIDIDDGIGPDDYSAYDSDADVRASPVEKFDVIDAGSGAQLEFWPLPDAAGTVRFEGTKALETFVSDDDNCTLDATLITLYAAAKLKPDDQEILAAANQLYARMTGYMARKANGDKFSINQGAEKAARQPRRIIAVHSE